MDDLRQIQKLAIHQPNFMPWMGYFLKMAQSDYFVLLDDVQFSKGSYTPRVNIHDVNRQGNEWLTIPTKKHSLHTPINEIQLDRSKNIEARLIDKLSSSYSHTAYFQKIISQIENLLPELRQIDLLSNFNTYWIEWLREILNIDTTMAYSSHLLKEETAEQIVLTISKQVKASNYLSGKGGESYIDRNAFAKAEIGIEYVDYGMLITEYFKDIDYLKLANKSIISWLMLVPLEELRVIFQH